MKSGKVQSGSYAIHYVEQGQGVPLVLLHGFLANASAWSPLVEQLSSHYRCICIDLLGFGQSDQPDIPFSVETQVAIVRDVVQSLELSHYSLMGHSFGGWVAAAYALTYQAELQDLVLVAPAGIRDRDPFNIRPYFYIPLVIPGPWVDVPLALSYPWIEAAGFKRELQFFAKIRKYFVARPNATEQMLRRMFFPSDHAPIETVDHRLHELQVPTLVIAGMQDQVIPFEHAEIYADRISSAELIRLEDAKHDVHISYAADISRHLMMRI